MPAYAKDGKVVCFFQGAAKFDTSVLQADPIPVKLAVAWASFMFLYVYVDILGLYKPGTSTTSWLASCGS